jgi:hypothetical protein
MFSVVVHGDVEGVETLKRSLADWLSDIGLIQAGHKAVHGSYVGYMTSYATSHDDLDRDRGFQEDVRNAARALAQAVKMRRKGRLVAPDEDLVEPRPK